MAQENEERRNLRSNPQALIAQRSERRRKRKATRQKLSKHQVKRRRKITGLMLVLLIFAVSFGLGFLCRSNISLMVELGVIASPEEIEVNPGLTVSGSTYDSVSARVAEIEGVLKNDSLDEYSLDTVTTKVINAFIKSIDDGYLRYYSPDRYNEYIVQSSSGSYAGIGVLFSEYNGMAYAVDVFSGSEAEAAGVQVGDFVKAINGDHSQNWTATEVANALAKNEGSTVAMTWRRPVSLEATGGEEFTTTLSCKVYKEVNVTSEIINGVGCITIKQLTANSSKLVAEAVERLANEGAKAIVLDLRDCPGGYLTQAYDIADGFLEGGVVYQIVTKEQTSSKTATATVQCDLPLTVLVNGNTSGAAEVIAAALQENERATVVGEPTLGKGSVQVIKELSFGGALRYTAAYYLTPLGHKIDGEGVAPNITIKGAESQKSVAIDTALSASYR